MGETKIEWTNKTWNPVRGCSVVSEGCRNCYAMNFATRFAKSGEPYEGLAYRNKSGAHWTGKLRFVREHLEDPLKWRAPARIFVNSMSDLFHESVDSQWLNDIFGIMALAHWHTFQVLTKRPEHALSYLTNGSHGVIEQFQQIQNGGGIGPRSMFRALDIKRRDGSGWQWPLPNVWLGVSVEDQKTADERIPLLLQTPAAVRWISAEPLLGLINARMWHCACGWKGSESTLLPSPSTSLVCPKCGGSGGLLYRSWLSSDEGRRTAIEWVVVGGESGPKARPFDLAWGRSIVEQCRAANVPVFVKQLGANPFYGGVNCGTGNENFDAHSVTLEDKKGGDINEWPNDLRVREFPAAVTTTA